VYFFSEADISDSVSISFLTVNSYLKISSYA
jgi:hypothetical protein